MKRSNYIIAIGFILCAVFFISALVIKIPNHYISFYFDEAAVEYVGGDAYNYIIEAALRGGEIAGKIISKVICFSMSAYFLFASLKNLLASKEIAEEKTDKSKIEIQYDVPKNTTSDAENKQLTPISFEQKDKNISGYRKRKPVSKLNV